MKRGIATFTLDYGKCPPWLFERMTRLAGIIVDGIVQHYSPEEFLKRLSDPVWFQAFGSLLAFDWNASGLTTTTMGALKSAIFGREKELGFFIAGGKGKTSKKSPDQILSWAEKTNLDPKLAKRFVYLSRLTAKVDSALIQDEFQIYHHNFIFTKKGQWAVIQQGMNTEAQRARRYHWYSDDIDDLTIQPHSAIQSEIVLPHVLNLTDKKSIPNREGVTELVKHKKDLFYEIHRLKHKEEQLSILTLSNNDFYDHPIDHQEFSADSLFKSIKEREKNRIADIFTDRLEESVKSLLNTDTNDYESVLMTTRVGPKTMRALTLISEVIFGAKPSYEDPVRYSYAFGGKDGIPYPVNQKTYDDTIEIIEKVIKKSNLSPAEKDSVLKKNERLFTSNNEGDRVKKIS